MRLNRGLTSGWAIVAATIWCTLLLHAQAPAGQRGQAPAGGRGEPAPDTAGRGQGGRGAPAPPIRNPAEGNAEAIRAGGESYRARCAECHGADAVGGPRGSGLTGLWAQGSTDVQIFQSARRGIPNSLLSHSYGPDADLWP